jgi:MFS transporter, DHA2 family, multidrug resistance protein
LDWFGFGTLSLATGAQQIMLDRGEIKDWFGSGEIILEALIASSAFYLFLVHTFTTERAFVRPALFRDRNFAAGVIFSAVGFVTLYASLALQPPYLQELMNYPVVTAGLVMGPRGLGTMAATILVGRLVGKFDTRLLLGIGLALSAWSFYVMTGWTPDISQQAIVLAGLAQGAGFGFLLVPMSTVTLSTLALEDRAGEFIFKKSRAMAEHAAAVEG